MCSNIVAATAGGFYREMMHTFRIHQRVYQVGHQLCSRQSVRRYCARPSYNEANFRLLLREFPGGSVDLKKDEVHGIASIILNRPEKKNSLSGAMMLDLSHIITELEQWTEGRGVVVYGAGKSFCAGGDLDMVRKMLSPEEGRDMSLFMQSVLTRLHNLPLVSTALIQGHALGGGAELAVACDFRVMANHAHIGFLQTRIGLTTGFGAGTRLVHLVGRRKALEILTMAKTMSWHDAVDFGLADAILSDNDKFVKAGKRWLERQIPEKANITQAVKKMAVAVDNERNLNKALHIESKMFASICGSPPHNKPW